MTNTNRIYRLMQYNPSTLHYINLPIGKSKKCTGFWSTQKECIINLINAINDALAEMTGGGIMWGDEVVILETSDDNVKTESVEKYKKGHDTMFDSGEIFVSQIIDLTKVKYNGWVDFVQKK